MNLFQEIPLSVAISSRISTTIGAKIKTNNNFTIRIKIICVFVAKIKYHE